MLATPCRDGKGKFGAVPDCGAGQADALQGYEGQVREV
jgi:hypothetical protein